VGVDEAGVEGEVVVAGDDEFSVGDEVGKLV
jgi:hypothetical protein